MYRLILCVVIVAGMIGGIGSIAAADPPPLPTGAGNDLSENETATLWSKAPNDCNVDSSTNETAMQSLGQCADITFKEPPDTAARWTAHDFMTLDPGDGETAVYPDAAERTRRSSKTRMQPSTQYSRRRSSIETLTQHHTTSLLRGSYERSLTIELRPLVTSQSRAVRSSGRSSITRSLESDSCRTTNGCTGP